MFENVIKHYLDFPKPGIDFIDVLPFLQDKEAFCQAVREIDRLSTAVNVATVEARGFLFAAPLLAVSDHVKNIVPFRKKGKLPRETISQDYDLEYGKNTLEICKGSLKKGDNVLLLDDLLATGGTAGAMIKLVEKSGANIVSFAFIIELFDLGGAKRIKDTYGIDSFSLISFPGH